MRGILCETGIMHTHTHTKGPGSHSCYLNLYIIKKKRAFRPSYLKESY